ncbi:capsid and scaffold protein [Streptococcus phage CHPC927]|uniref:Capsid and scaffold protein n=1 Tax=Streptococcus phage CHPC927 TaxID=2365048 RepID=A0A3G8F7V0_9CAUD|nr:virion structural protein [Streptococcus phage CHPC927]AZF90863.1 capsid and scaffold protein [Streptococcus phage CHPC927]
MQIWIHDKSMRKVCALNNEIPGMLPYTNSQWHSYLEYSTSTFDFTIPKIVNGKLHDDLKYINDQMYVSFYYDNSYHVFYVSQLVENDFSFQVTCNNTNLELAREVARPLADSGGAKSVEWYLRNLELLGFAGLEIGVNEISDRTRTLTFESQSGTKLEQLHSLMNQFDAEFVFRTDLNRDGTLKKFVIDIYQRPDENHHGIGKARGDVVLYYQSGLKGVQVTSDKTQLFNAGVFTGADGVNLDSVEFEEKNELGQVEFYSRKGTSFVFAPLSREHYPSTMNPDSADNWTRKDFQTEYKDVESLKAYALRTIKQYAYPLLTYTVDVQSSFLDNYKDINLGDTIKIVDNNFRGGLALEARVSEMIISFDNPTNNSVVFTNFRKLDNKPSIELQQRIDEIVSKSLPYHVEIRTTNGTVFKNGIGHSTVKPILKQGDKIVNATYRFVIDGTIKYSGMTYDMVASEINQPTTLTISAWVDNKEVASEEVTFVNVSDGKQGPKGDRGNDGLPGKDGVGLKSTTITYGMSDSDTIMPTSWTANPPTLIKGKYLWTKTQWTYTDSTSETGYQKTYIAKDGNNGNDGLPGKDGVGIRNTTITYAQGTSGTVAPTNGWSTQVPNVPAGQYLWTKTVWDYTDNTSETGYSVAKMGEQGPKGDRGERGLQGPRGDQGIPGPKGIDGTDAPTIFVKSYTYSAGSKAYIKLTGPNAFEQTLYYSRGHNVWVLDATTHKLKEFVHCDTYITMSFNHNGVNITLADYLNSITDSIVAIAAADADAVDQNFRDVLNKMGGNPELGTWSGRRTGHVFIGMSKRSDGTWPLQPRQGYEVAIQEDGSAPEIGCTLSIGGIVANGADGKTQYTHIAYANSADGSKDFSTSDSNRAYIGMYVDFNINDSTNPSDYSWTLIKGADGTQGVPGKPGADGKTPYFHTAWAYSADGTDGFTTVYPNLNLLEGTATFDGMNPNSSDNSVSAITKTKISGIANTVMDVKTSGNAFAVGFYTQKGYNITAGQTITISFIAKASSDTSLLVGFEHFPSGHKTFTISTKWELYTYTFTATTSGTPTFVMYGWDMVAGQGFQLYNPKAELGSVATPWMPSESEVTTADYPSFIGHYTNYTQVDSPNPRDYTWILIRGNDGKQGPQGPRGEQGIPGPKGADGKTQYTHIAYADTISGSGFSQTDVNKAYIGMYQDFNAEDSKNPQDYRWSKWKGSDGKDGIPGKAGADGRTPYVHFAYADSADGQTGFSLTQTGSKRYLGVLTNFIKEDSTNPSDYTWNDTAGSVSVGGENLIINSAFPKNFDGWGFWDASTPNNNLHIATHGFYYNGTKPLFRLDNNTNGVVPASTKRFPVKRNTDYSLNIQIFATGNLKSVDIYFLGRKANETDKELTKVIHLKTHTGSPSTTQTVKWHLTFNSGDCDEGFIRIINNGTTDGNTSMLFFAEVDCYEETTDRAWQASSKDLEEEIDTKADDVLTQAQLNRLNETNSIIKAELNAKASLDILNQWVEAYQNFVNANNANRAQAEKDLADASARVTKLENDLNDMSERWNFIDSYMTASNEGLVVGKTDNSSSMLFSPNGRISMFSAGNEVMYISQGVIHIENGIFSKTIQIGRYREEQDFLNPDRNVIRYVGGA